MRQILQLPSLPNGTSQSNIAGILPLSSLIEFIDVETKLHCYELSGRGIAWNWPITPVGARLILERCGPEKSKHYSVCLLDGDERTPPLQCIDMRFASVYVSASRFTVRTCIEIAPLLRTVQYDESDPYRLQRLDIIHVYSDPHFWGGEAGLPGVHHPQRSILTKFNIKWVAILLVGWAIWAAAVVISIICACPLALSYLLTLPATGLCIRSAFGHSARRLLVNNKLGKDGQYWRRSVIVANHYNEIDWAIFIGNSRIINGVLNKPLLRSNHTTQESHTSKYKNSLKFFFRVLIAGQWGVILAASAQQSWDAIFISVAIILCACTSSFIFRTSDSVSSWLTSNGIGVEKMSVTFTGRRAMLSAMIAVNPDRNLKNEWLNPILNASPGRTEWEEQVWKRLLDGVEPTGDPFLVESIQEGVQKASEINKWLLQREIYHNVPPRPESQTPFIITPPKSP